MEVDACVKLADHLLERGAGDGRAGERGHVRGIAGARFFKDAHVAANADAQRSIHLHYINNNPERGQVS
jgi:hypothetical protein